jgi:hypothetical protein
MNAKRKFPLACLALIVFTFLAIGLGVTVGMWYSMTTNIGSDIIVMGSTVALSLLRVEFGCCCDFITYTVLGCIGSLS